MGSSLYALVHSDGDNDDDDEDEDLGVWSTFSNNDRSRSTKPKKAKPTASFVYSYLIGVEGCGSGRLERLRSAVHELYALIPKVSPFHCLATTACVRSFTVPVFSDSQPSLH